MSQEHEEIKWHSNWVSGQFEFLKTSRVKLLFAKNNLFKDEIGRNRPMYGSLRSTIAMKHPLMNRCLYSMVVRSAMEGWCESTSIVWGGASLSIARWILIQRSRRVHASLIYSSRGSLKVRFKHVLWLRSGGPRVHRSYARRLLRYQPDARNAGTLRENKIKEN